MRLLAVDLHDRWEEPPPDRGGLARYLDTGAVLKRVRSRTIDLVYPTRGKVVPGSLLTDGVWVWPAGHAYYVERYAVRLPDDFVLHVRSADYEVAPVDEATLREIEAQTRRLGII